MHAMRLTRPENEK